MVGFPDSNAFIRIFKKIMGLRPEEDIRRAHLQNAIGKDGKQAFMHVFRPFPLFFIQMTNLFAGI